MFWKVKCEFRDDLVAYVEIIIRKLCVLFSFWDEGKFVQTKISLSWKAHPHDLIYTLINILNELYFKQPQNRYTRIWITNLLVLSRMINNFCPNDGNWNHTIYDVFFSPSSTSPDSPNEHYYSLHTFHYRNIYKFFKCRFFSLLMNEIILV